MKIAIACDHAGFKAKEFLKRILEDKGHEVRDFGCHDDLKSSDYPEFGIPATWSVAKGKNDRALLICSNGIGMSMLANKIPGILAALVYSTKTAAETRLHHDSNVLCLGARQFSQLSLVDFLNTWLACEYEGGRHEPRISLVRKLDLMKEAIWKK